MEDLCLICGGNSDSKFVTCKDVKSWRSLYDAAVKQNNVSIISISSPDVFPCSKVRYHRQCRSTFTLKTYHTDEPSQSSPSSPNVSILTRSGASNVAKSDKKEKYIPRTRTRRKLKSFTSFDAHARVKKSSLLHITQRSPYAKVAENVLPYLIKDLISSEGKYHAMCYDSFVKITHEDATATVATVATATATATIVATKTAAATATITATATEATATTFWNY